LKIIHFSSSPKPWTPGAKKGDIELIWQQAFIEFSQAQSTCLENKPEYVVLKKEKTDKKKKEVKEEAKETRIRTESEI